MKQETKQENITENKKKVLRKLSGIVVSDKMDKTIVVKIDGVKIHPKYNKRYLFSKKYKAHDENNKYKENDKVTIIQCRPLSKDKKWRAM